MTQDFLEKLVALAPNEPFPHLALANLFQERDQLGEAARHLDQATARADKDPAVQSYLRTVTAKVRGTEKSEARLTSRDSDALYREIRRGSRSGYLGRCVGDS